jgi:glycosidase
MQLSIKAPRQVVLEYKGLSNAHYGAVQARAAGYLNHLASQGVAGIRIDAAKHMNHWDLGSILQVSALSWACHHHRVA